MMMKKNGQSKQLYHLKSSYVQIEGQVQVEGQDVPLIVLGFCAEEIPNLFNTTIPPMGSLSPNEYCGAKIKNILIYSIIYNNVNMSFFGIVDFYGKLPENATGVHGELDFTIPQLNVSWTSLTYYRKSTNTTSCISDEAEFAVDSIDSLENLYITIAPHVSVGGE